mmetsp:Transcript_16325/g.42054  ORF Transcript_16325/g.42054 Transcript_16325/m.42054 type:complete len:214 (+) Transcript_16325:244-885(+)
MAGSKFFCSRGRASVRDLVRRGAGGRAIRGSIAQDRLGGGAPEDRPCGGLPRAGRRGALRGVERPAGHAWARSGPIPRARGCTSCPSGKAACVGPHICVRAERRALLVSSSLAALVPGLRWAPGRACGPGRRDGDDGRRCADRGGAGFARLRSPRRRATAPNCFRGRWRRRRPCRHPDSGCGAGYIRSIDNNSCNSDLVALEHDIGRQCGEAL